MVGMVTALDRFRLEFATRAVEIRTAHAPLARGRRARLAKRAATSPIRGGADALELGANALDD
jgi:hypothetical protein